MSKCYFLQIPYCHSLEWPIFRHTIDPNSLSVCVCVCLSELTNEKVKGFPLISFVMTSDEISDFRQKLNLAKKKSPNLFSKNLYPQFFPSSAFKKCVPPIFFNFYPRFFLKKFVTPNFFLYMKQVLTTNTYLALPFNSVGFFSYL